jgi:DNA-directed RNA polymerase specialized sigma24 family protein
VTLRRNLDHVYRYALAVCGDAAAAEDVTQATFAEAYWARLGRVEPWTPRRRLIDIAHEICRRRADKGGSVEWAPAECAEGELAISLQADGRLGSSARRALTAHLRGCSDCAGFLDELEGRRDAWRELACQAAPEQLRGLEKSAASLPAGRHLYQ